MSCAGHQLCEWRTREVVRAFRVALYNSAEYLPVQVQHARRIVLYRRQRLCKGQTTNEIAAGV